jgi:hypothetical protein
MSDVERVGKRYFQLHFLGIAIRRVPEWRSCLREWNALICFHLDLKRPSPTPTANTSQFHQLLEVNEETSTELATESRHTCLTCRTDFVRAFET